MNSTLGSVVPLAMFFITYFLMNVAIKISFETVHWYIPDANYSTEDLTRSKVPLLCGIMLLQGQVLNSSSSEVAQQAPSIKHQAPPILRRLKSILGFYFAPCLSTVSVAAWWQIGFKTPWDALVLFLASF